MNAFRRQFWSVVAVEWGLLRGHVKVRLSAVGIIFLPALYALIYLSSVWDPNERTAALPVGLVSEDVGITYQGAAVNVGRDLLDALERTAEFDYRRYPDADAAREAVRNRTLIFALIVPAEFSRQAAPGGEALRGKLTIYTSEGNTYTGAGIARRFAPEVAHQVNEMLSEKRWALVLESSAGSTRDLSSLGDNLRRLKAGADQVAEGLGQAQKGATQLSRGGAQVAAAAMLLSQGATQLADVGGQLSEGMKSSGAAVRQAHARLPSEAELRALRSGATSVSNGHALLADAFAQMQGGADRLTDGLTEFKTRTEDSLFIDDDVVRGVSELSSGAGQLATGLRRATVQHEKLQAGAKQLETGVNSLTAGTGALGAALSTMSSALPEDKQLDEFAGALTESARATLALRDGTRQLGEGAPALATALTRLEDGNARVAAGLDLLVQSLPTEAPHLDGSASGLAASVQSELEIAAPVANNGTGLAPNFVPMALWVGALMTSFLYHVRKLPAAVAGASDAAKWIGKLAIPALLTLGQALVMLAMMVLLLDVQVPHVATFALTLAIASLSFLAIIFAMVKLLGDIGKVLAALVLILQLSSAGALIPIELTNAFFQDISPFLPFTWVVRAFRATLFGAFEGAWLTAWTLVILAGLAATVIGMFGGRWKIVPDADYGPAVDID